MLEQDIFAGPLHWPPQLTVEEVKLAKPDNSQKFTCAGQRSLFVSSEDAATDS